MWAMSAEYTGARKQRMTISRKSAPKASATLLRRSRRQASWYGPIPGGSSPSSATRRSSASMGWTAMGVGA